MSTYMNMLVLGNASFYSLEVVDRVSETQFQVGESLGEKFYPRREVCI